MMNGRKVCILHGDANKGSPWLQMMNGRKVCMRQDFSLKITGIILSSFFLSGSKHEYCMILVGSRKFETSLPGIGVYFSAIRHDMPTNRAGYSYSLELY